jgi:hypothetical protein
VAFREFVDAYRLIMRPGQMFVGRTAMRLWGLPFPVLWDSSEPLHVTVVPDAAPPRGVGVKGRRLAPHKTQRMIFTGVPVVDPVAAVLSCAAALDRVQLVTAFDALLTDADGYPGILALRPLATTGEIRRRLQEWGRFKGCAQVREALELAREGVESPKETETRLLIVDAGLSEPVVQHEVRDGARLVARVDLAYPELRIAIEYDGDGHCTDKEQWRRDIRRRRELERLGWVELHLTQSDLGDPVAFLGDLRNAVAVRAAGA